MLCVVPQRMDYVIQVVRRTSYLHGGLKEENTCLIYISPEKESLMQFLCPG